ncbi:MAG: hypothetical protein B7X02_02085, partial [Rhodospirillales bacterium 12-54-5]
MSIIMQIAQSSTAHKQVPLPLSSRWNIVLVGASILAVALYFALHNWTTYAPIASVDAANIPLLIVMILGGLPLLIQIGRKLITGSVGADFLGAIELIAAAALEQYLAAILIIIMLSGGQALEAYAMRKASSALRALTDRMPVKAHRKNGGTIDEIALSEIAVGDEIVIFPNETAPVDGVVT